MLNFKYIRCDSLAEALDFLAQQGAASRIIAGGTDLLVKIKRKPQDFFNVKYLLDITALKGYDQIVFDTDYIYLGPLTTYTQVAENQKIKDIIPILASAAAQMGSPQIRNRGTLGGNIVNACPAADAVYPLIALDAEVQIQSKGQSQWRRLSETITGPYRSNLTAQELLTAIRFPYPPQPNTMSFQRLARREALAIARMSVAVIVSVKEGLITECRIAPGAVMPAPTRIYAAEDILINKAPDAEKIALAATLAQQEMIKQGGRRWSTAYKEPVLKVLVQRALGEALGVKSDAKN